MKFHTAKNNDNNKNKRKKKQKKLLYICGSVLLSTQDNRIFSHVKVKPCSAKDRERRKRWPRYHLAEMWPIEYNAGKGPTGHGPTGQRPECVPSHTHTGSQHGRRQNPPKSDQLLTHSYVLIRTRPDPATDQDTRSDMPPAHSYTRTHQHTRIRKHTHTCNLYISAVPDSFRFATTKWSQKFPATVT